MAPAASNGPNAIADWFAAPIEPRWPAELVVGCEAGTSAANAGSLNRRAQPMPAPSTTSIQYSPRTKCDRDGRGPHVRDDDDLPRPEAVDGQPAERPHTTAGSDHDSDSGGVCAGPASNR